MSFADWQFALRLSVITIFAYLCAQAAQAEPPKPKDGPLGMKFVPLPKGTFYTGWNGTGSKGTKTEIKAEFEIAIYTVTQGQWQELIGKNPSYFSRDGKGKDAVKNIKDEDLKQFPVEQVSWDDVQEFIKKLNEQQKGKGYQYRLPTEAEWEYACRGGATTEEECSYFYYFAKPTNDLSSKEANCDGGFVGGKPSGGPSLKRTTKVGSYAPNKLGLYDMHGNVLQWCEDLNEKDPIRPLRGGSWSHDAANCRAMDSFRARRDGRGGDAIGFRFVRVPVERK
jgi:formylglycine-generating enzyme required for sulfatase activity